MRPYELAPSELASRGGQAEVILAIKQRLAHAALDAESLGRILLMLDWLVSSGAADPETVDRLLAGCTPSAIARGKLGGPITHDP